MQRRGRSPRRSRVRCGYLRAPSISGCCRRVEHGEKAYGKTAGGAPITDELVDKLAKRAEAGYDVDETLRRRGGRPPLGSGPTAVESVRQEPELRDPLGQRAKRDQETTSSAIRKALREYLERDRGRVGWPAMPLR